jgi:hypothetical protein
VWHPLEGPDSGDCWCKDIGRGGGESAGDGGCEGTGSGIVNVFCEGRRMGSSRAPRVRGSLGFPGPQ